MGIIQDIRSDLEQSALQLLREYRSRLYADAMKLCNDPIFSEDLVIQTIAEVCRSEDHYDEKKGDFYPWMRGILEHLHAHSKRRLVTRGTTPVDPEILALDENLVTNETDDHILKNSDNDALREAVERLPPIYRQAIVLRYFEEFPAKDIAIITNAPVGTIFRRLNVARKLLAKELAVKFEKKKPIAVLLAVLLGIGTLFGAWQVGVSMIEAMSDDGRAVSMKPPITENDQTTLTTKEEPPMNKIKGTLLAAATAVSLMSTAQADEPTPVTPDIVESSGAGTVKKVGDDYVLSFTDTTETYALTLPDGVKSIRYLVVAGGGAGGGSYTKWFSGGGGGAGGMLTGEEGITVETGNVLTIKVGKGGAGSNDGLGADGEDSVLQISGNEVRAWGGGGGGGGGSGDASVKPPNVGGSGGGGNGSGSYSPRSVKICAGAAAKEAEDGSTQGCAGGGVANDSESQRCAGGGGGAGGAGDAGSAGGSAKGGNGGLGKTCDITGEDNVYYAGGGGGGAWDGGRTPGEGGSDIGGKGGKGSAGDPGKDGTGSGGGGGSVSGGGGKGGDGIVIIRYTSSATAKAKVHFSYDPNTVTWVATDIGGEVEDGGEVDNGATVTVVATPKDGYEYASAPEGWTKNEDDTVTAGFVAKAPECTIQIPAATAIPFTMNFTPGANASYTATVDGQLVQNGDKIRTGKQIVVVATPNTDCEYTAIPPDWSAGEVEGTLTRTITAGEGVPQLTIPDAAAIDYVQVQFTSNGSAFFEATNAVGEKVEGRVRAGTEVFVKIWAGVGFVYTETPTGWTWEAEGDAYTKSFTAVSGSTLTIQIPNAKEIGGKWTKEIPANIGYKLEVEKDLVFVFTNTAAEGCEMILPSGVTSLRYLVVGGGGAGGGRRGGGGGAGGMLTDDEFKVVGRTLKITVGKGGEGVKTGTGTSGGNSTLETGVASIVAYGGGGGGVGHTSSAGEGGSGGGGGGTNGDGKTPLPGASAKDSLQGNAGGTSGYAMSAAGGGGAGDSGKAGSGTAGGAGGAGRTCDITGEDNKYYAAGGGGASRNGSSEGGAGGSSIGGNGGKNADGLKAGLPGVDGTGSGGGGAADDTDDCSGKGGDGVVILRFKKPSNGIVIFIM